MSKAEELALELYTTPSCGQFGTGDYEPPEVDVDSMEAYIKGYHQAEEDLKLTIEDIKKIHAFLYAVKNNKQGAFTFTRLSDEKYQEVLKRFNERRNK